MAYTGWTVSIKIYPLIHFSNRNDSALSQSSNYAYSCSPPHILSSSSDLCPCPSTSAFLHADIQSSTSLRSTCLYHLCLPRINSRSTNVKPIFTNYYTPIKYTSIQVSTRTFSCIFVVDVRPAQGRSHGGDGGGGLPPKKYQKNHELAKSSRINNIDTWIF